MVASLHYTARDALPQLRKMLEGYADSIGMITLKLNDNVRLAEYAAQFSVTMEDARQQLENTQRYGQDAWNALALAIAVMEVVPAETAIQQKPHVTTTEAAENTYPNPSDTAVPN